jgi:hypothetical protein
MKRLLAVIFFSVWTLSASAQSVTYESVRVADLMVDSSWEQMREALSTGMESANQEAKANGVSYNAARVFTEEMGRSFTRENCAKAFAQMLAKNFSTVELKQLEAFLRSSAGQKYMSLSKSMESDPSFFEPITKQACDAASKRLTPNEFGQLGECKIE